MTQPKLTNRGLQHTSRPETSDLQGDVVIGKDILELLSTAMYVNPLSILREYVQNAADSIDDAYANGIFTGPCDGRIEINLDRTDRTLSIRDNGTGIGDADVERILLAFGDSPKRGGAARGFRGVGRLGGLGFARTISFATRSADDEHVAEVKWDCVKLKAILSDPSVRSRLVDVVRDVVEIQRKHNVDAPDHFFEVRLEGVIRLGNDDLLNPELVHDYLSQVAPVPLNPAFSFAHQIEEHLGHFLPPRRFQLFLNGDSKPLHRPHVDEFSVSGTRTDSFSKPELLRIGGTSDGPAAVGWLLHHGYTGALLASPEVRGLRARVGDIQVGGSDIFVDIFPETRFNSWVVGEIHILDERIIPNGRRDNFEPNVALRQLVNQLVPLGREIGRRCRGSSMIRNRIRAFELGQERVLEMTGIVEQGMLSKAAANSTLREIAALLDELGHIATAAVLSKRDQQRLLKRLERLKRRYQSLRGEHSEHDALRSLSRQKAAAYQEFIALLYECAPSKAAAKSLVDKIATRLAANGKRQS